MATEKRPSPQQEQAPPELPERPQEPAGGFAKKSTAGLAIMLMFAVAWAFPSAASAATHFTDWTSVSGNVASGTLLGNSISLSGSHITDTPSSTVDGTSTVFTSSFFTPPLPLSDAIQFTGFQGYSYALEFGGPVSDPVLHIQSLASTLAFPSGTQITKVSGEDLFTVSGSAVVGALDGSADASGTVRISGTFTSISFSATPVYPPSTEDGILLQVGAAPPPPPPPPPPQPLVARMAVFPNPTCVGIPTVFDASSSTAGAGGPITNYRFDYYAASIFGLSSTDPPVIGSSPSPVATYQFPWGYQSLSSSRFLSGVPGWSRPPVPVTLTITDAGGGTATTTSTVEFVQGTTAMSRDGCPDDSGTASPTIPPRFATDPTVSGFDAVFQLTCVITPGACTGDVRATVPSLRLEARRQELLAEQERSRQTIDDAREQQQQILDQLSGAQGLERQRLLAEAGRLDRTIHRADDALDDTQARLRNVIDQIRRILDAQRRSSDNFNLAAMAAATRRKPDVIALAPYRISPGDRGVVRARLHKRARRVLRRYGRLRASVSILALTPHGARKVRSRVVTLEGPKTTRRR